MLMIWYIHVDPPIIMAVKNGCISNSTVVTFQIGSYFPLNHDLFGRKSISWKNNSHHNPPSKTISLNLSKCQGVPPLRLSGGSGVSLFRQGLNHLAEFNFFKRFVSFFFQLGLRNHLYEMSWLHPKKAKWFVFFKEMCWSKNMHFLLRKINHPTITTKIDSWKRSFSVAES